MKRGVGLLIACACLTLAPGAWAFSRDYLSVGFRSAGDESVYVTGSRDHVELSVGTGFANATYRAPGKATRRHLQATFGRFGSIDMTFEPTGPERFVPFEPCSGGSHIVRGKFTGSFEFLGDAEYEAVSATAGQGDLTRDHIRCRPGDLADDPDAQTRNNGTVLEAGDGERFAPRNVSFSVIEADETRRAFFNAQAMVREGDLQITRSVYGEASSSRFDLNVRRHTATVTPPAPFTGQATLAKGPDGPEWSGDLTVDIPAAGTVALTGPGISAHLFRAAVLIIREGRVIARQLARYAGKYMPASRPPLSSR
jgi:hypothetical protein